MLVEHRRGKELSALFTPAATATAADLVTASTLTSTPASTSSSEPPVPDTQAPSPTELLEEIHESATVTENVIYDHALTDPGLWNTKYTVTVDHWIFNGPTKCQNHDCDFSNSRRVFGEGEKTQTRYLTNTLFKRELRNGEFIKREWLLYSPPKGCLYFFPCRLLSKKESPFATSGFNDWKHSNVVAEHEN